MPKTYINPLNNDKIKRKSIKIEKINKQKWVLLEDFDGVPKGFVTDGASVPRLFWAITSPATDAFEAALMHDWLLFTRNKLANVVFLRYLLAYDVPFYRAYLLYLTVVIWTKAKGLV